MLAFADRRCGKHVVKHVIRAEQVNQGSQGIDRLIFYIDCVSENLND